jgi:hypothetical protein
MKQPNLTYAFSLVSWLQAHGIEVIHYDSTVIVVVSVSTTQRGIVKLPVDLQACRDFMNY